MKKILLSTTLSVLLFSQSCFAQDEKPKLPPSPPAKITETIASGAEITIAYSQPAVKGRIIGKTLEPLPGKVWRTGANNATTFETSKDITVGGKSLAAGKYSLFTLVNDDKWTIIFNKTWKQWGAFQYNATDDVLRVDATLGKATPFAERLNFIVNKSGLVTILWGDNKVDFSVK